MGEADEMTGRCIACGFLAYRAELVRLGFEYQEIEPDDREAPGILYRPRPPRPKSPLAIQPPDDLFKYGALVCFRRRADLPAEMKERIDGGHATDFSVRDALEYDRHCPEYVPYTHGLTPKDHLLERRVIGLEEDRRAFQLALDRGSKRLMWAALILGGLLAAGQLLAAFFATPDAYGSRWLRSLWPPPTPPGINDRV